MKVKVSTDGAPSTFSLDEVRKTPGVYQVGEGQSDRDVLLISTKDNNLLLVRNDGEASLFLIKQGWDCYRYMRSNKTVTISN